MGGALEAPGGRRLRSRGVGWGGRHYSAGAGSLQVGRRCAVQRGSLQEVPLKLQEARGCTVPGGGGGGVTAGRSQTASGWSGSSGTFEPPAGLSVLAAVFLGTGLGQGALTFLTSDLICSPMKTGFRLHFRAALCISQECGCVWARVFCG